MTDINRNDYKIIFSDIDGTLINAEFEVSEKTAAKIRELDGKSVPFVLVSARMPSGIFSIQADIGIKAPIICYSGALVLSDSGETLYSAGIDRKKAEEVDSFIRNGNYDISLSTYCGEKWIVDDTEDEWVLYEQHVTGSVPQKGALDKSVSENEEVHKFLCMGEADRIARLEKGLLERFPKLSVCRSKDTYLEVMAGGVQKSAAMRFVCVSYGLTAENAVAFGDNFNDIDMLEAAGMSFAVANAPEEVKLAAKRTTKSNEDEGVLAGLEMLD